MQDRFSLAEQPPSYVPHCATWKGANCGGTWVGILNNLDYIQGMNFDAIWMSPIVAQLPQMTPDGRAYAGYWQQNLYSINTNYGTAEELQELIAAMHSRGMFIMMDVVVNHMAYDSHVEDIDYSVLIPFNDTKYYHPYCEMDYSGENATALEQCWLGGSYVPLADLRTEDDQVREMFGTWIEQMVSNYSVDGLRIDAGVNVEPEFFTSFVERAGVFATAEVYIANATTACQWEKTAGSILNYPIYWPLTSAFQADGSIGDLVDMIQTQKSVCHDPTTFGTFSENQDVPRFANHTSDLALAQNVATFVLMSDGIPIIYQGQEQHFSGGTNPYTNREPLWESGLNVFAPIYAQIATLNTLRHHIIKISPDFTSSSTHVIYQDAHAMVMRKGVDGQQALTVLTNEGSTTFTGDSTLYLDSHGFPSGTQLTEVLTCAVYTVNATGWLNVPMSQGQPRIMYPTTSMTNSSLCDSGGQMFNGADTVTATTYTTTIAGTMTVVQATATLPVVAAVQTPSASSRTLQHSSGASTSPAIPTRIVIPAVLVAVVLAGGIGSLLSVVP